MHCRYSLQLRYFFYRASFFVSYVAVCADLIWVQLSDPPFSKFDGGSQNMNHLPTNGRLPSNLCNSFLAVVGGFSGLRSCRLQLTGNTYPRNRANMIVLAEGNLVLLFSRTPFAKQMVLKSDFPVISFFPVLAKALPFTIFNITNISQVLFQRTFAANVLINFLHCNGFIKMLRFWSLN